MARRYPHGTNDDFYSSHMQPNENDELIDGLQSKVNTLKSLSLDMGEEIREQNRFLTGMDNDFDSTFGALSNSMSRLKKIALAGHNRYYLYLILFSLFVFFVIYVIMKTR